MVTITKRCTPGASEDCMNECLPVIQDIDNNEQCLTAMNKLSRRSALIRKQMVPRKQIFFLPNYPQSRVRDILLISSIFISVFHVLYTFISSVVIVLCLSWR